MSPQSQCHGHNISGTASGRHARVTEEVALKNAVHMIEDDDVQRPAMQRWLQHVARARPGSFFLPEYDDADILRVFGCARGAPNAVARAAMYESRRRRQLKEFAFHEPSWDDHMAALLGKEPLVLRVAVDRSRNKGGTRLLKPNSFQFNLLALAIAKFREALKRHHLRATGSLLLTTSRSNASPSPCTKQRPPGRTMPVLIAITWYRPSRPVFHAHQCAVSIEVDEEEEGVEIAAGCPLAKGSSESDMPRLKAVFFDPIQSGKQLATAEHARDRIEALLRGVLLPLDVPLVRSTAHTPQCVGSKLCAPYSLLFLHARALGLRDEEQARIFDSKSVAGMDDEAVGLRYANHAARLVAAADDGGEELCPFVEVFEEEDEEPEKSDYLIEFVHVRVPRRRRRPPYGGQIVRDCNTQEKKRKYKRVFCLGNYKGSGGVESDANRKRQACTA